MRLVDSLRFAGPGVAVNTGLRKIEPTSTTKRETVKGVHRPGAFGADRDRIAQRNREQLRHTAGLFKAYTSGYIGLPTPLGQKDAMSHATHMDR